jgi:hypothetical protein
MTKDDFFDLQDVQINECRAKMGIWLHTKMMR